MPTGTSRLRRTFVLLTFCTLAVFAALLCGLAWVVRGRLRREVLNGEAGAIHAVALMQVEAARAPLERLGIPLSSDDVFAAVLESSRLRGVLAVELYDANGALQEAFPEISADAAERGRWWPHPLRGPVARYERHGSLEEVYGLSVDPKSGATLAPILEVVVPLTTGNGSRRFGVARYWIDGSDLHGGFGRLDANLAMEAGVTFLGGGCMVALLLAWAYRRLNDAQARLLRQTADLERANEELDFAAKTGALGAISAHLIHGLKNPLAGLEGFVAEAAGSDDATLSGEARQTAVETARRLRALVNDVVTVLRDEATGAADYAIPLRELVESVRARAAGAAAAVGVRLGVNVTADAAVNARTGNLAGLVLANLLANAIEASSNGGDVRLDAGASADGIEFLVTDSGAGLPDPVRTSLFRPVKSTKRGGGGMGLAISARLARHAGGELSLVRSDATGTAFRLALPRADRPPVRDVPAERGRVAGRG